MKKLMVIAVIFIAVGLVAAFGEGQQEAGGVKNIKVGHGLPEDTGLGEGFTKFKEVLEAKSNGAMKVEIYPNGQLGGDRELTESLQLGNVDLTAVSATNLAPFAKEFYVLDTFFMFDDRPHVYRVLEGKAGDAMLAPLEEKNMMGLGFWENGFRHLTNSKRPVKTTDDMGGIKMRVAENPVQIAAWEAVGAGPTPMAWGELFTALQQGTLDGQERTMENIVKMKFYEVQENISLTGHKYSPYVVIMNLELFNSFSEQESEWVLSALEEATAYQREVAKKLEVEGLEIVKAAGNTVIEVTPEAKAEFRSSMMGAVNDMVKDKAGAEMYKIYMDEVEALR